MTVAELKEKSYQANMTLPANGLVKFTWGNASAIDRNSGLVAIKPSGVPYNLLTAAQMVVVALDGTKVDGDLHPSSDTAVHLELYRCCDTIGGIVHTHSAAATSWAQAGLGIPCYGTTHADYFCDTIPCSRQLSAAEVADDYELNIARVIVEVVGSQRHSPLAIPGVLVKNHGPFTWGKTVEEAAFNAAVLEELAELALQTIRINPAAAPAPDYLISKHYQRKHGDQAYYGQRR